MDGGRERAISGSKIQNPGIFGSKDKMKRCFSGCSQPEDRWEQPSSETAESKGKVLTVPTTLVIQNSSRFLPKTEPV